MYKTPEEAIEAARKELVESDDLIEFAGQNCNETADEDNYCGGWDGVDKRCSCGNRRVYWSAYQDDDGGYYAVAMAD